MLEQTRDVVERLKSCGLKRHEFRVRCERITRKGVFCGYGDVEIVLWCDMQREYALAPEIAKHFYVVQYMIDGVLAGGIHVYGKGAHGLVTKELNSER